LHLKCEVLLELRARGMRQAWILHS
jgi:hypothetical protein